MVAVTVALVVVAVALLLAGVLGELSWRSDVRRHRAFTRDNEAQ